YLFSVGPYELHCHRYRHGPSTRTRDLETVLHYTAHTGNVAQCLMSVVEFDLGIAVRIVGKGFDHMAEFENLFRVDYEAAAVVLRENVTDLCPRDIREARKHLFRRHGKG